MKKLLVGVLVVYTVSGCGSTENHDATASWAFEFVKWHDQTFSNRFSVGTKLFSILNTDVKQAIAIETPTDAYEVVVAESK